MNPATYERDIEEVRPGGYLLHDSSWPMAREFLRDDITFLGVPLGEMCVREFKGARVRILMKNIAYSGALAALLSMDMDVIRGMIREKFSAKPKLIDSNYKAIELGYDYAMEHFDCPLPIRLETMDATSNHVLMDGNTAAALGCVFAGATVGAWYPITPSTSLMDAFKRFCERFRKDPETGERNFFIAQVEDELAAAGVVIGAGWAGARAFTPTSGPGISLMGEFIGLAYYAEVPSVFVDVQRVGPSTGMPTRTQQGDIAAVAYASHGDTKHIVLFPANPEESFHMAVEAFDLAEHFQTPVFLVQDLDIGMNDWMIPKLEWDDGFVPDRGKVLGAEELEAIDKFYRYMDVDGDGIPYRTLPGVHAKGAYFTRGSGHTSRGTYTEDDDEYTEVMDRLRRKIDSAARAVPAPVVEVRDGATMALVTIGSCDGAVREAADLLERRGVPVNYMRVRGFPFDTSVREFLDAHELNFVVEQNRDAQLRRLLVGETEVDSGRIHSILDYGGFPLSAAFVAGAVSERLGIGAHGRARGTRRLVPEETMMRPAAERPEGAVA